ncbi:MAG: WD40/YVTN/BNR-like repeat-containing protein, partial [Gaiellaceae bacterium]
MTRVLVATGETLVGVAGRDAEVLLERPGLHAVAVDPRRPERIAAGSRDAGVWESEDGGSTWTDAGLPAQDVYSVAYGPDGSLYAGCEPSTLYVRGDGDPWRELAALRELPSAPTWSFPPRPWTSHVRWIAPSPHDPAVVLVGIELGGLMRTADGGETWADHRPGAQRDVHALAWHPTEPDRAYEAAGGGAAWSHDGGETWEPADEGRDRHYTWALAVDPADPDRWYVSAAP